MTNLEFATLYNREVSKVISEVNAYSTEEQMWVVLPGTINSAGNLVQHLIGNLRTYIVLVLGKVPYERDRDAEFGKRLFTKNELLSELQLVQTVLADTLEGLSAEDLLIEYPHDIRSTFTNQTVSMILTHLLIHLGYHLGQINYHRRFVCAS
ncbi:DinB family protein [Dyadobacter sp. CY312]|uniref:DinB family protein n=1 Tax=Dyadobacter sp. CY312 TaxID=2907303 RepID=UPI001F3F2FB3|nr:DUF1572 family protein [Dyadobacter sp. CY312]MCE7039418.1 DUF1572 domain-containing protein [Dyadobacter sp. CY312]